MDQAREPAAAPNPRVLITGTGRAGTTLLVQVLTDLGLDTGFSSDAEINESARAGLEKQIDAPDAPRIVKSPNVIRRLGRLLDEGTITLEHVIIPLRDLDVAAASRVRMTRYGSNLRTRGGLLGTLYATRQREALAVLQYELLFQLARHEVPHTFLLFPRFTRDWEYTFRQLSFLDPSLPPERWREALEARVVPELVHELPLTRRERIATTAGTMYNRTVVRPLRGVRKLLRGEPRSPRPHRR